MILINMQLNIFLVKKWKIIYECYIKEYLIEYINALKQRENILNITTINDNIDIYTNIYN